ncbi:type II secretion system protein N [Yokenella regensburgei]|uniref:type II secretion system protein N n=1 Tax=Yokenella regensburgei TaxID=158877 RepID=UPI003ED9A6C0
MLDKINVILSLNRVRALYVAIAIFSVFLAGHSIVKLTQYLAYGHRIAKDTVVDNINLPLHYISVNTISSADAPTPAAVQESTLPSLTVTGITYSSHSSHSRAIIKSPEGQKSYAINTPLEKHPDTLISQIHPDKVILKIGVHEQVLELEPLFTERETTSQRRPAGPQSTNSLDKYIKATVIYSTDKKIVGLRLNNNISGTAFRKTGLIPGDLAIKMNDRNLQDRENIDAALADISLLNTAKFTILRDKQQQPIKITTQDFITNMDVK